MEEINKIVKTVVKAIKNQGLSYDDYKLLLLKSGISEDDTYDFFINTEDGTSGPVIGVSSICLKKKLTLDNKFLKEFNKNMLEFIPTGNEGNENGSPKNDEIVFEMTYDSKFRKVFINGRQVKKFGMDSENSQIFEKAYNNPNGIIEIDSKRRAQDFVNGFGFRNKARSIFFPTASGNRLMLNNPVRKSDLIKLNLENTTFEELYVDIR